MNEEPVKMEDEMKKQMDAFSAFAGSFVFSLESIKAQQVNVPDSPMMREINKTLAEG